ncbi:hypothetical protein FGO68_gene3964 [Halteria grandinella]|uniref:Uncharacterized protein n=1 Tax=Halteria grandinella TaxID=5974 RepID=A0A8J8NUX9_HALGN|nr:hypothetical protein FGO68_gene3964 [Halteria grandinella]
MVLARTSCLGEQPCSLSRIILSQAHMMVDKLAFLSFLGCHYFMHGEISLLLLEQLLARYFRELLHHQLGVAGRVCVRNVWIEVDIGLKLVVFLSLQGWDCSYTFLSQCINWPDHSQILRWYCSSFFILYSLSQSFHILLLTQ